MSKFFRNLFSTVDGQPWELSRVLWAIGVIAFITYAGIALLVLKQAWNAIEYGTGFGAVLAAGGFATAQKDKARAVAQGNTTGDAA